VGFVKLLSEKPWLTEGCDVSDTTREEPLSFRASYFGLKILLSVATVLFMLTVIAYAYRMTFGDWKPIPEPWLLWINTGFLVLGSVGMQKAWNSAYRGYLDGLKTGMLIGGVCIIAFLIGQCYVWEELVGTGYYASANVAAAFFYVLTAFHALHVLGGLVAWLRASSVIWRHKSIDKVRTTVELCAIYWHFLLFLWIVLFALLLLT